MQHINNYFFLDNHPDFHLSDLNQIGLCIWYRMIDDYNFKLKSTRH